MARHDSTKPEGVDFEELADNVDEFREVVRAMVAGLVADGFTDREARGLLAGFFATNIPKADEGEA